MGEPQIHQVEVNKEDLSHLDSGGAFREVLVTICVDSSLPMERQRVNLVHEILGAFIGSVVDRATLEEMAEVICEKLDEL